MEEHNGQNLMAEYSTADIASRTHDKKGKRRPQAQESEEPQSILTQRCHGDAAPEVPLEEEIKESHQQVWKNAGVKRRRRSNSGESSQLRQQSELERALQESQAALQGSVDKLRHRLDPGLNVKEPMLPFLCELLCAGDEYWKDERGDHKDAASHRASLSLYHALAYTLERFDGQQQRNRSQHSVSLLE
jgi:hypothetical protein